MAIIRNILRNAFSIPNLQDIPRSGNFSYSNNNVFERFLETDLLGNKIECPVMARKYVEPALMERISLGSNAASVVEKVSIPLYTEHGPTPRRTASSIFKFFERETQTRLDKVVTNKGEVYYGGKGIILNAEFKVLALCVLEYNLKDGGELRILNKLRVYIHPSVFLSNGLVEKGIIKTYIPSLIDEDIYYPTWLTSVGRVSASSKVEVTISDVTDKFIKTPVKPKVSEFTEENVNKFLLSKFDKICEISKL